MSDRDDPETRLSELDRVDASLRALAAASAAAPDAEDRLARNFEELKVKLRGEVDSPATRLDGPRLDSGRMAAAQVARIRRARVWIAPVVLAAAAALVVYLLLPARDPVVLAEAESDARSQARSQARSEARPDEDGWAADLDLEEELAWALGYVYDPTSTNLAPGIPVEDLEFIEQLEVLEYLAARDSEERG